jgi:polysaccharide deacetylase 2 family uncharacterized protein YibQ
MARGLLIRRLLVLVRRHGGDSGFALLFAVALIVGISPALGGLAKFAEALTPGMAAEASDEPVSGQSARLVLFAVPASRYSPQVLFPIQGHAFPEWLRARLKLGAAPAAAPSAPVLAPHPVIAICIDDLGEDIAGTDKAMALPRAVAMSFLPYAETTPFLATEAARKGHEILAHVPMEAVGAIDPGPMALKVGAPDAAARLAWNLARVPGLVGINNHEGSKFTADAAALTPVAETLAARHLFFFDSRTGPDSKVVAVSHMFGVESAGRDIFLDDVASEAAIDQQLEDLVAHARQTGVAIAIGHPHDLTLKLLAAWLARDHGVTLVPLSEAIRLKTERMALASR